MYLDSVYGRKVIHVIKIILYIFTAKLLVVCTMYNCTLWYTWTVTRRATRTNGLLITVHVYTVRQRLPLH